MLLRYIRFKISAIQWWRYGICFLIMAAAIFRVMNNLAMNLPEGFPAAYSFPAFYANYIDGLSLYVLIVPVLFIFSDIYSGDTALRESTLFLRLPGKRAWTLYNVAFTALLALFALAVTVGSMFAVYLSFYGFNPVMFSGSMAYNSSVSFVNLELLGLTVFQAFWLSSGLTFGYYLFSGAFLLLFNLLTGKRSMGFMVVLLMYVLYMVLYWIIRPAHPLGLTPLEHQTLSMMLPNLPSFLDRYHINYYYDTLHRVPYWSSFLYFGLGSALVFALTYFKMLDSDILSQEGLRR